MRHERPDSVGGRWFASLRGYRRSWLAGDAGAALTLAAIAVPEQLATARLTGLPPTTGLIAFAAGSCAYAALGTNRFASIGADSTIAPIMASALALAAAGSSAHDTGLAALLALLVGLALIIGGLLQTGWIADLLSVPVTIGFLAGISIHIIVGQMAEILGLPAGAGPLVRQFLGLMGELPQANLATTALSAGVIATSLLAERLDRRIPGPLIAFLLSGLAVSLFDLQSRGVAILGALPIEAPHWPLAVPGFAEIVQVLPATVIVAVICMIQTAAVVRAFPNDGEGGDNINRDFIAVGAGSILAAALGAFAVNASPPRSAIVKESGGETQLTGLMAVGLVAAIAIIGAGFLAVLPQAALSGMLIVIGIRIFRVAAMRDIYRRGGYEISLVAASAALVVVLPIQIGVTMSILLSLVHSIYIIARPHCAVLSRLPGTTVWWKEPAGEPREHEAHVLVFAPGAPIHFTNAHYIRDRLMEAVAAMPEPCRLVVIEANGVIDIDYTGSLMLERVIAALREQGIALAMARLESQRAQDAAVATGLIAKLGEGELFRTVEDAIRAHAA